MFPSGICLARTWRDTIPFSATKAVSRTKLEPHAYLSMRSALLAVPFRCVPPLSQ